MTGTRAGRRPAPLVDGEDAHPGRFPTSQGPDSAALTQGGAVTSSTPTKQLRVVAAVLGLAAAAPALGYGKTPDADRYIVEFKAGKADHGKSALKAGGSQVVLELGPQNAVAAHIPPQALNGLRNNPNIESIEADVLRYPMSQDTPYGITMVQANAVTAANPGNRTVCIIDSGYSLQHEDPADTNEIG